MPAADYSGNVGPMTRNGPPRVIGLLPARNAAHHLLGYFESIAPVVDAVAALDDGSTDETAQILEAEPLVELLFRNPPRPGYKGWDDSANRNRLLAGATELEPDWFLFLDSDERLDPDDAAALREFIDHEAVEGCAYGMRVFRMIGDLRHWDRGALWVYRLFARDGDHSLPEERLHFVPVPRSIPMERWLQTTIRIQHLAGLTGESRRARFEKHREADPLNLFQPSYENLLEPPGELKLWERRPPGLAVLETGSSDGRRRAALSKPVMSAVVISRDDGPRILPAVRSVVSQRFEEPFEVIVVVSGTGDAADLVGREFSDVTVVELERPALPGEARNAGLRVARGAYVSFPGSHVELPPDSLAARVRAHRLGYTMVTGTVLNGTRTAAGWASYFLDHSSVLPARPSGVLDAPPMHCSYERTALLGVGGFPEDMRAGEDTVVNRELFRRGHSAYRAQDVRLTHHSRCRGAIALVRHHFSRGRAFGTIVRDGDRRFLWTYVPRRISRTSRDVRHWGGELRRHYLRAWPLVVAGTLAAWLGLCYELLRGARGQVTETSPSVVATTTRQK